MYTPTLEAGLAHHGGHRRPSTRATDGESKLQTTLTFCGTLTGLPTRLSRRLHRLGAQPDGIASISSLSLSLSPLWPTSSLAEQDWPIGAGL